jgi:hypothetical protein
MRKIVFIILLVGLFGCAGPKYISTFDKNHDALDFSKGKWILNKPFEKEESRMQYMAHTYFKKILGDSLKLIDEVKNIGSGLMKAEIPFSPSKEELREIKAGTDCDYLINIKGTVLNDEMSGFAGGTTYGSTIKTNAAKVELNIYDLNHLKLLSSSSIIGKEKRELNAKDYDWSIVESAKVIKNMGLYRLIKKYKQNQKRIGL